MSLDQPLLKSADYGMTASELMELFKPDNIRNGSSTQLLARLGKLDGIYYYQFAETSAHLCNKTLMRQQERQRIKALEDYKILHLIVIKLKCFNYHLAAVKFFRQMTYHKQNHLSLKTQHGSKGLNSNDVSDFDLRVKNFGDNKPIEKEQKKLLDYILENFEDKILQILCLAAFVNLIIGVITEGWAEGWMDGFAIFIAVIIIVSVTAGNNYIKDQQFRKLNAIAANRNINVIRGGKTISFELIYLNIRFQIRPQQKSR